MANVEDEMNVLEQYGDKSKRYPSYTLKWVKVHDDWYVEITQKDYETVAYDQIDISDEIDELERKDDYDLARWKVLQDAFVFVCRRQWR